MWAEGWEGLHVLGVLESLQLNEGCGLGRRKRRCWRTGLASPEKNEIGSLQPTRFLVRIVFGPLSSSPDVSFIWAFNSTKTKCI